MKVGHPRAWPIVGPAAALAQHAVAASAHEVAIHTLPGTLLGTGLNVVESFVPGLRPPRPKVSKRGPLTGTEIDRWMRAELPLEIAVRHPKFARAVLSTHLHKRLAYYGHPLEGPANQPAPGLQVEGVHVPWRELEARFSFEHGLIREKATGDKFDYLEEGLVRWDYLDWKEIRPFRTLPPEERPTTPALEIITRPARVQDFHAWIRLITTDGKVYSVGLRAHALPFSGYGPIAKSSRAHVSCPDIEEFFAGDDQRVVRLPLTEEKFTEIKAELERYPSSSPHFNYVDHNCSRFTAEFAARAGASIDVETSALEAMIPAPALAFIEAHMPRPARVAVARAMDLGGYFGPNIFENVMLCLAGGTMGTDERGPTPAIIQRPTDLVGRSKLKIAWPGRLKAWQAQRLAATPREDRDER